MGSAFQKIPTQLEWNIESTIFKFSGDIWAVRKIHKYH